VRLEQFTQVRPFVVEGPSAVFHIEEHHAREFDAEDEEQNVTGPKDVTA
jgi:hypothetical protein